MGWSGRTQQWATEPAGGPASDGSSGSRAPQRERVPLAAVVVVTAVGTVVVVVVVVVGVPPPPHPANATVRATAAKETPRRALGVHRRRPSSVP